jgi:hypothetical protein
MFLSCCRVKGIPDPLDAPVSFSWVYGHHVETAVLFGPVRVPGQVPGRRSRNSILFSCRHGIGAAAVLATFPVLDLNEHDSFTVLHDKVNFTKSAVEIPVQ